MLDRLMGDARQFFAAFEGNIVSAEDAMRADVAGLMMYDAPIFGVAAADDPLFDVLRDENVIHPDYNVPSDWLEGAVSVISFFLPFSDRVKEANAADLKHPVDEWMHGRVEGEAAHRALRQYVQDWLRAEGYRAVAPSLTEDMRMLAPYCPNWSERHTAYIAGLGTFGLSKGLITEKGVAGRLGSVITDCPLPARPRAYAGIYDYCNGCGLCAKNCPVACIDASRGMHGAKEHPPCERYLNYVGKLPPKGLSQKQRYGCGKCQVAVPCQNGIPARLV